MERLSVSNSPLLICAQTLSKLQLFLCCQPNDKLEEAVRRYKHGASVFKTESFKRPDLTVFITTRTSAHSDPDQQES